MSKTLEDEDMLILYYLNTEKAFLFTPKKSWQNNTCFSDLWKKKKRFTSQYI